MSGPRKFTGKDLSDVGGPAGGDVEPFSIPIESNVVGISNGEPVDPDDWRGLLVRTKEGKLRSATHNYHVILSESEAFKDAFGYDERGGGPVVRRALPGELPGARFPRPLEGIDDARIAVHLNSVYHLDVAPGSAALAGAIDLASRAHSFDDVRDYLDGLEWDGTDRLDRLLTDRFGAEDTALHGAYGAKWLISAVARAFAPGCKVDTVLVLVGAQGLGKSTAAQILAGADHFGDNLPDLSNKDSADYIQGLWIVELSELEALRRSDMATVKAFVSRQNDRYRASYGKRTEAHPRRVVFLGSTNDDAFLTDGTGNRRWWPVRVAKVDTAAVARDRDQLWAEAVHRYKAGEPWHLEGELAAAAVISQESHTHGDVWAELVGAWLHDARQAGEPLFSARDILVGAIGMASDRIERRHEMRLADLMKNTVKWDTDRMSEGGVRTRVYIRPLDDSEDLK